MLILSIITFSTLPQTLTTELNLKRFKSMSLAILGSGWSGSGAMVELLKKVSLAQQDILELDFWRRPNGLHNIKINGNAYFFGNEIFSQQDNFRQSLR